VRISVLASWVSLAPSVLVTPSVWSASRMGSPMPVWSAKSFCRWNRVLARAAVAITSV